MFMTWLQMEALDTWGAFSIGQLIPTYYCYTFWQGCDFSQMQLLLLHHKHYKIYVKLKKLMLFQKNETWPPSFSLFFCFSQSLYQGSRKLFSDHTLLSIIHISTMSTN